MSNLQQLAKVPGGRGVGRGKRLTDFIRFLLDTELPTATTWRLKRWLCHGLSVSSRSCGKGNEPEPISSCQPERLAPLRALLAAPANNRLSLYQCVGSATLSARRRPCRGEKASSSPRVDYTKAGPGEETMLLDYQETGDFGLYKGDAHAAAASLSEGGSNHDNLRVEQRLPFQQSYVWRVQLAHRSERYENKSADGGADGRHGVTTRLEIYEKDKPDIPLATFVEAEDRAATDASGSDEQNHVEVDHSASSEDAEIWLPALENVRGGYVCGADKYESWLLFDLRSGEAPLFRLRFRVSGPQKKYLSEAEYWPDDDV